MIYKELLNKDFLTNEYLINKTPSRIIAKRIGCTRNAVLTALRRHNIPRLRKQIPTINISKEQLEQMYVVKNMTALGISQILGCNERTVSKKLRNYGIKTKRNEKRSQKIDLCGQKIGRLNIIRRLSPASKTTPSEVLWECKCKCGNTIVTNSCNLLKRKRGTKSCGCAKSHIEWKIIPLFVWSTIIGKARYRGIDFEISREYGEMLFEKQKGLCALSGIPIIMPKIKKQKRTASLDRIDSKIGYVPGNVQWVHNRINSMKSSMNENDFIELCRLVASHNKGE
jgi:DNA-binding CsgD family transcriptional regulator